MACCAARFNEGARTGERPLEGAVANDWCRLGAASLDLDVEIFDTAVLMQECVVFVR